MTRFWPNYRRVAPIFAFDSKVSFVKKNDKIQKNENSGGFRGKVLGFGIIKKSSKKNKRRGATTKQEARGNSRHSRGGH